MLSLKKPYDKYGDYTVYIVDDQEIRNLSKTLQEFSNYAIHSDFPHIIKKNEIWLSYKALGEQIFLISEALNRIKYEIQGMSADKAYDKALKKDKSLRQKMLHSKHITIPTKNIVPAEVYLERYGTIRDIDIWIVNGELIRDFWKTDFVEGSNDYADCWVPRNNIFIDSDVSANERIFIILHEFIERELMKNKHLSYDKAHEKASKIEWRLRKIYSNFKNNN